MTYGTRNPNCNMLPHLATQEAARIDRATSASAREWQWQRGKETVAMQFSQIAMHQTNLNNHWWPTPNK